MSEAILVALISGGLALLGTILTNNHNARELDHKLDKKQAVTDTKIDELTREVRKHNDFAERIPVLEHWKEATEKKLDKLTSFHEHP